MAIQTKRQVLNAGLGPGPDVGKYCCFNKVRGYTQFAQQVTHCGSSGSHGLSPVVDVGKLLMRLRFSPGVRILETSHPVGNGHLKILVTYRLNRDNGL